MNATPLTPSELFTFGAFLVAVILTAVFVWLYISGRLESAIETFSSPKPKPSEAEKAAEGEGVRRFIDRIFAPLDWLAERPVVRRIVGSRFYYSWFAPATSVAMSGVLFVGALFGGFHWVSGLLGLVLLLLNWAWWRATKSAERP